MKYENELKYPTILLPLKVKLSAPKRKTQSLSLPCQRSFRPSETSGPYYITS